MRVVFIQFDLQFYWQEIPICIVHKMKYNIVSKSKIQFDSAKIVAFKNESLNDLVEVCAFYKEMLQNIFFIVSISDFFFNKNTIFQIA